MGQAQLLLIVLGTVVVGLAVMAGINAYEQNNIKADQDAVVHECMRLASDAQTAAQKPVAFGGLWDTNDATELGHGFNFDDQVAGNAAGVTLAMLGWSTPGASSNITINTHDDQVFNATCQSIKFQGTTDNSATVNITGVNANDITMTTTLYTE